jgi:hypothetical protein
MLLVEGTGMLGGMGTAGLMPAWATLEARRRLMRTACENAQAFVNGDRINIVNGV